MAVKLKSESEMRIMREAGQIVGQTLAAVREKVLGAGSDMPSMPVGAYDPARDTVARHNVISLIV